MEIVGHREVWRPRWLYSPPPFNLKTRFPNFLDKMSQIIRSDPTRCVHNAIFQEADLIYDYIAD